MATQKKAKAKKAVSKKAVAMVKAEATDLVKTNSILDMVNSDINNAEIGKFYALRAGVGLLVVKAMCPHGEWGGIINKAMPGRAPRTIRSYMADSKKYLDDKGVAASEVWQGLSEFEPATMLIQGNGGTLLLASGDDAEVPPPEAAADMAQWLNARNAEATAAGKVDAGKQAVKAKLTRAQKKDAATAELVLAIGKINNALVGDWILVDTETLDTVAAALTLAAYTVKEELKKRG